MKVINLKQIFTQKKTKIDIPKEFNMYIAGGAGNYKIVSQLTVDSIKKTIPALNNLISSYNKELDFIELISKKNLDEKKLEKLFKNFKSDKSTVHNYHLLYSNLFEDSNKVEKVFEIGLGTNNSQWISNMGKSGNPGASLYAFKEFFPFAQIYGADIDKSILFKEERIITLFLDQTLYESFDNLDSIGDEFDLMIDDGLHSPHANLNSLRFFLKKLKIGGFAIIEDINPNAIDLWQVVSQLLPPSFKSELIQSKAAFIFKVKRCN